MKLRSTMASNGLGVILSDIVDPDIQKFPPEGLPHNSHDVEELQSALTVSSEIDTTLAYSSEKLANLENLFLHVLAEENDPVGIGDENDMVSAELIEKAFKNDVLYAILSSELKELDSLMGEVPDLIGNVFREIFSSEQPAECFNGLVRKLHDAEELLKQSQERILEIKIQLMKLQMTSFSFKQNEWKQDLIISVNEELQLAGTEWKPQIQTVEQRRVLRMLEKSLARELELEKKLTDLKQNEQDLKAKMRLVEQLSNCMEEAAEAAWGRFLEADNKSEVLMGISKEILGKLQVVRFNLTSSTKKEEERKSKQQDCIDQLNAKDTLIQKLETSVSQLMTDNAEVKSLREKVQMLESKLVEMESRLKTANNSNEMSQQKLDEMEVETESLRENLYAAESRAGEAEEKVTHLTESNVELTEELEFVRGSNENNSKKVSLLEKQLRDLEIQLQHTRTSSEASQEQQNMLYSAIWDMETLIDELKQKVAKAETKTESTEERCIMLSETNSELNKELDYVKSRMRFMESSLDQANLAKIACAKDISIRTSIIMDTVMQLAMERERIQKQLITLTKENTLLRGKTKNASTILQDNRRGDDLSGLHSVDAECEKASAAKSSDISSEILQVAEMEVPKDASPYDNETDSATSANHSTNSVPNVDTDTSVKTGKSRITYIFMALLVLVLSVLAVHLFQDELTHLIPVKS